MDFKDYYKILGVEPEADAKTIKVAYRKLAKKYHPDVSGHEEAEEKFKEVAEAYEVLKNAERRTEYDELRQYAKQGRGFQPPPDWQSSSGFDSGFSDQGYSDFFSSIFGGTGRAGQHKYRPQQPFDLKGQDIETELPIFLEDTLADSSKTISIRLPHQEADGQITQVDKKLNVKIPAGVADGEQIRLRGQGGEGMGKGPRGDLYLRIRLVPHPLFDVEAHNLILTVPLAPWEAAMGCKIEVPTLSGKINLSIPANSQTGQRMRVKGKGLVSKTGHGDLYAVLKVVMPTNSSEEIQQHWQQLASSAAFDPRAEWRN